MRGERGPATSEDAEGLRTMEKDPRIPRPFFFFTCFGFKGILKPYKLSLI